MGEWEERVKQGDRDPLLGGVRGGFLQFLFSKWSKATDIVRRSLSWSGEVGGRRNQSSNKNADNAVIPITKPL
jgi:hypothetical protein